MKVAFINQPWTIAAPPKGSDSSGIWTYQIARRLINSCEVIFYGCQESRKATSYDRDGISYRGISLTSETWLRPWLTLKRKLKIKSQIPYFASSFYYLGYIAQIALDLRQQNCDIVHIHNFSQFVPIVRAFNPQAKIVLHMHCEWLSQLNPETTFKRLQQADLVISCSEYLTQKIRDRFPTLADKCQTVYNGVDATHFIPNNTQPIENQSARPKLLFVGRISPEKGVHLLIDAFREVVKHYPQAKLAIVGPEIVVAKEFLTDLSDDPKVAALAPFYFGSYLEKIKQQIPPQLSANILFPGSLPQEQLLQYYQHADIVINPSFSEAFGMSLVEGMACEVPVIGARVGGMTEAIADKITGLLFDSGDAMALADTILQLLADEQLRKSMGKAGRERVLTTFAWEQIAKSLVKQYQELCFSAQLNTCDRYLLFPFYKSKFL
jgi:glycosyltransferase involved in cell wall biosynthesis